jgi:1-aminocyclopropane-1-carboxylate deaminase/D-cysteine desulfhydrase-like pyridoxal-dependent ACC family enzyme
MTGRCQGFNCLTPVCKIISKERNIPLNEVSKKGSGSEWFPYLASATEQQAVPLHATIASNVQDNKQVRSQVTTFDYIIIGGGPAGTGAAIALTSSATNRKQSVLLLERSHELGGIPRRVSD